MLTCSDLLFSVLSSQMGMNIKGIHNIQCAKLGFLPHQQDDILLEEGEGKEMGRRIRSLVRNFFYYL